MSPTLSMAMRSLESGAPAQECEVVMADRVPLALATAKAFPKKCPI